MSLQRELVARFGGKVVGADDPTILERWTAGRTGEEVLFATIEGLEPPLVPQAYASLVDDDVRYAVACSCDHEALAELTAWACERTDTLFVASPGGPPPPSVFVLEKAPPS